VISEVDGVLPHDTLEVAFRVSVILQDRLLTTVSDRGKIGHDVTDGDGAVWSRRRPPLKPKQDLIFQAFQNFGNRENCTVASITRTDIDLLFEEH
jgi:hypothetical protein